MKVTAQYRAALIAGLIAFAIHLLLVLGVLYLDLTASKIVYLLDPSYGVPVAAAFAVVGGLQWFLIVSIIVWMWKRERVKPA